MTTATNRRISETTSFLAGEAYTGGVDANWRFDERFEMRGYWAGSTIHGSAAAIERLQKDNRLYRTRFLGHTFALRRLA